MNEKMVLCEECRKMVPFCIENETIESVLKGKTIRFNGKKAYCKYCEGEVFVPEIEKSNLEALKNELRLLDDIIGLDDIRSIPEKYGIGKRNLSLLLGWGEQTFSRYFDGFIPKKVYSDMLKNILTDPYEYVEILENNKNIIETSAYEKSKKVVESYLKKEFLALPKIEQVANIVISVCNDITNLSLQKILCWIQGFGVAFYDKFVFQDDCQAWPLGPVYPDIYHKYKCNVRSPIKYNSSISFDVLSAEELEIIFYVCSYFGIYGGGVLAEFSHMERPWDDARDGLEPDERTNKVITKEAIKDYFSDVLSIYQIKSPKEISVYRDRLLEVYKQNQIMSDFSKATIKERIKSGLF